MSGQAWFAEDEEGFGTEEICLNPDRTVSVATVCGGLCVSSFRALSVWWVEVFSWSLGVGALSAEEGAGMQAVTAGAAHSASSRSYTHTHTHTHTR